MADNFNISDEPETGAAAIQLNWRFSTNTTIADPGNKNFRYDNADPSLVTEIAVNDVSNSGVDASSIITALDVGDQIYIQQTDDAGAFDLFTVVSVTDETGWFTIVVTVSSSGTLPGNARDCGWILLYGSGGPSAGVTSFITRTGAVVAAASDYDASIVDNDSGVAGAFVDDALDNLAAAIPPAAPVDSVFTRTGAVAAAASDYDASQVDNDSGIAGAFVDDALDNLGAAIPPVAPVDSVFTRTGAVVAAASDYAASIVDNDSGVAGAFVDDALDNLAGAIPPVAPVDSVFTRTGAVVAAASDYDAGQVDNDSNVAGAFVDDALNNLRHGACQARRTTDYTLTTSFADISLDTTDVEIDAAIIDHEGGTPDRITFGVTGTFEIHWQFVSTESSVNPSLYSMEGRVRVNDTTVLDGSFMAVSAANFDPSITVSGSAATFLYEATAADFITLQAQRVDIIGTGDPDLAAGTIIMTAKRVT